MYRVSESLDDLLLKTYTSMLRSSHRSMSTRGDTVEKIGVLLKLTNPRARLSRSGSRGVLFSCVAELLWYLSGSGRGSSITPYLSRYQDEVEKNGNVHGAYGPRLFNWKGCNQLKNVTDLLRKHPPTRRAVLQLFDAADIEHPRKLDVPCTTTIQFLIRGGKLEAIVNMRSNDACFGLVHDVFAFTMLQEIVARDLGLEMGCYHHSVGSLHLYEEHLAKVTAFVEEGWQTNTPMNPMPLGDPWGQIKALVNQEKRIRSGNGKENLDKLDPYWKDLAIILKIFFQNDSVKIRRMEREISTQIYASYIKRRRETRSPRLEIKQIPLIPRD